VAIHYRRYGTGLTERPQMVLDSVEDLPELAEKKQAFTFEGWVRVAEQWAHEVLTNAGYREACRLHDRATVFHKDGPPADEDGDEDFAERILTLIHKVRSAIRDGDAARAAMDGVRLGELIALHDTKTMHEPAWNTGTKNRHVLAEIRDRTNKDRHAAQESEWARWNEAAAPIWKRNPLLSKNDVARQIIKTLKPARKLRRLRSG
jgi:hypothetical protein